MDDKSQYQTPDYSCLSEEDKKFVYEPAEDSFLLLDSLEKDYDAILALRCVLSLLCFSNYLFLWWKVLMKGNVRAFGCRRAYGTKFIRATAVKYELVQRRTFCNEEHFFL